MRAWGRGEGQGTKADRCRHKERAKETLPPARHVLSGNDTAEGDGALLSKIGLREHAILLDVRVDATDFLWGHAVHG